jgi:hypothetical protein
LVGPLQEGDQQVKHAKKGMAILLTAAVAVGMGACAEVADPDKVGLYYMRGNSDGNTFGHCINPGVADDMVWNNEVIWLPTNLRTWNIAPQGGDSNQPITVASKPEPNQPSGVQVNVWTQTNFMLNTNCDGGKDSPVVKWWESQGRRYKADTDAGWTKMLENTIVTALTTSTRNVVRTYGADALVAGSSNPEVQTAIATQFQTELKRLIGGDYLCGPTFNRTVKECPPVEVILKDIDYTDPGIQEARNKKQKAVEEAAAAVAAAQGQVDAAKKLNELYQNKAWMELQKAQLQLQQAQSCAASTKCTMIMTSDGIQIHTS